MVRDRRVRPGTELTLGVAVLVTLAPILWMLVVSVQTGRAIISPDWELTLWWGNYRGLVAPGEAFLRQLANSVWIVAGAVALCLVVGALGGYALSKLPLPRWVVRAMLVPAVVLPVVPPMTLVPGLYATLYRLGLLGSLLGLVLLNTVFNLPFSVLLLKIYFDGLPTELREAALMDGASESAAFWRVLLPLVRPGLAAVAIFSSIMVWNDLLFGLTMTSGGTSSPVTVGIAAMIQPYDLSAGRIAAAGTVTALPIIVLAAIANRYIVAGLTRGAVKG